MRSVGHLTTYGPIDSPTFATPFLSPLANRLEELDTNKPRTRTTYCNCSTPPGDTDSFPILVNELVVLLALFLLKEKKKQL